MSFSFCCENDLTREFFAYYSCSHFSGLSQSPFPACCVMGKEQNMSMPFGKDLGLTNSSGFSILIVTDHSSVSFASQSKICLTKLTPCRTEIGSYTFFTDPYELRNFLC